MEREGKDKIERLIQKGVRIPCPESVLIGKEVATDRIAGHGVVIYPACKVFGEKTLIMSGVELGYEGPVTVEDCQVGPNVKLNGGFFRRSAFLEKASMGYGAQVRDGCILEEQANGAHTVGIKQTILFPFVTLGSLVNFCDCLMAGGTSRKDHSEVGSSYVHFNYTANQDKATPSLMGDVPRGVMLNQPPIFLGGQGGVVGPVRFEYGTVIAAGVVYRKDVPDGGKLVLAHVGGFPGAELSHHVSKFHPGVYWHVRGRVTNNITYIANLIALRQWYGLVRSQFLGGDPMARMLHEGVLDKLDMAIRERIGRFKALAQKMPESAERYRHIMKERPNEKLLMQKRELWERWQDVEAVFVRNLDNPGDPSVREPFLEKLNGYITERGNDYVSVIRGLDQACTARGTAWLQGIVDTIHGQAFQVLPSCRGD